LIANWHPKFEGGTGQVIISVYASRLALHKALSREGYLYAIYHVFFLKKPPKRTWL